MKLKFAVLIFALFELSQLSNYAEASSGHDVWDYLFTNGSYNRHVRPVRDWQTETKVNISVAVIAIVEFNEVKQMIMLTTKLLFTWNDEYLTWDPNEFMKVSHIHAPQSMVWKPFIVLENSITRQSELGTHSLNVIINHDGVMEWTPVEVFTTTCTTNVRRFPFDTQKCSMVFEALGYKGSELKIHSPLDHVDFHGYGGTTGWIVTETEMGTETEDDSTHIVCSLTLKRNPVYYILNIFLPIVLLSFMNNCVFLLPVQSGEKASFVITVFLALAVFLTIVSGNLPENSDSVSLLNVYVFMSTLLSVIIAIVTIIQIRVYHRDPTIPVSGRLSKLATFFTFKSPKHTTKSTDVEQLQPGKTPKSTLTKRRSVIDIRASLDDNDIPRITYNSFLNTTEGSWPMVTKAVDNLLFFLFLIINCVMTMVIFIMAMNDNGVQDDHDDH